MKIRLFFVKLNFSLILILHSVFGRHNKKMRDSDPIVHFTMQSDVIGTPLSPDDFEVAKNLTEQVNDAQYTIDPIEYAGLYEGDINVTEEDAVMIREGRKMATPRSGTADDNLKRRWPNGVVPYVVSNSYSKYERGVIAKAFSRLQNSSCIRFVPRGSELDYIHILQGDGCFSSVGRKGGGQVVSIGVLCVTVPMIMHELMHTLGFWHEQSRSDREQYVTIIWDNIMPGMKKNFDIIEYDTLGIPYDAKSLMHYKPYTFSKNRKVPNGNPTIISKTDREMGQRRDIEESDIKKINTYYQCESLKIEVTHAITPEIPSEECIDKNDYCLMWESEGECINNPAYMHKYCMKSCKVCHDPNSVGSANACEDKSPHCQAWKENFQCMVNPGYMNIYCKLSCGGCKV